MQHTPLVSRCSFIILHRLQSLMNNGDARLGLRAPGQVDAELLDTMVHNGCVSFTRRVPLGGSLERCLSFQASQLAQNGVKAGADDFLVLIERLAVDAEVNGAAGALPRALINADVVTAVQLYASHFLDNAFWYVRQLYADVSLAHVELAEQLDALFTAVFVLSLVALAAFYYNPLVMALDQRIKHARFALLFFPDDVLRHVPQLSGIANGGAAVAGTVDAASPPQAAGHQQMGVRALPV
ncbi:hypothetical protein EON66_02420 [archaeon]|nr:MAG: hypothetical protein EON66_02420 [archaeon]